MEHPYVELKNVSQRFGSQAILEQISLKVDPGMTLALIGESGCGKSVTTKLMAGLLNPTAGEVLWSGVKLNQLTNEQFQRERLRIGYLFQSGALFDSMNVYENVAFGLRQNTSMTDSEIETIVHDCIQDVGLTASTHLKMPSELSGGMRKRVGLARTLAMRPELIIYDEPTTGLDPIMSDVINELILKTRLEANVTSVVVTHDMNTVQRVADYVVMLQPLDRKEPEQSQILFEGTVEDLMNHDMDQVQNFVQGIAGERLEEMPAA